MNDLLIKKEQINKLKEKYTKKLFIIENDLIKIEKELAKFSELEIVDSLTLSNKQQQIVNATDENILCLACAGSGKTHTLISRYVNLILKNNVVPTSVLLITFTKKAGQEMLDRLKTIIPNKLPYHTGSLHGLSYKILQKNLNYTIIDENDTKRLLELETNYNIENEPIDIQILIKKNIYNIINKASTEYPINFKTILKNLNMIKYLSIITKINKAFIKRKKLENLLDFNDLMVLFCNFLTSNKSEEFKKQIKYIFFDEYQDVNPIQNYILNMFKNRANIMVVGDDAQSIYSFRGSSIKCILDFPTNFLPNKKYLLEENYRSTPAIVNFCQNIIENNVNQYNKKVVSLQKEEGIKPDIHAFNSYEEQYMWIVNDIKNKKNYSDIVILARKNDALDKMELLLNNCSIPVVKLAGRALLERPYIKDFIAFVTILSNNKSSIHWKRILSLHYHINIANDIVEKSTNILNTLSSEQKNDNVNKANKELINIIKIINNTYADLDKAKIIIKYLSTKWTNNDDIKDLNIILLYLKNHPCSLKLLIDNLFLNTDLNIENEGVSLSTIHGSKGLEWSHVYIVDVNSNDFPNIKHQYYKDELESMEEERRLFYVACSRAKKFLTITYHNNDTTLMSLFIREIDPTLYYGNQVITNDIKHENNIDLIFKMNGYKNIMQLLLTLEIKEKIIHDEFNINNNKVVSTFLNLLIFKIIHNNFKVKNFDVYYKNIITSKKILYDYTDEQNHWCNLLNLIYSISTDNNKNKNILINDESFKFYKNLELGIKKIFEMFKPKNIYTNYNIGKGTIDLILDDVLIDIKITLSEVCTLKNMCKVLSNGYLLSEKNIIINKIIIYNVLSGTINIINSNSFNFKLFNQNLYLS